ncbi:MAG: hypothetical protein QOF48_3551 [Verrucomicrobiota bacterium]|jgi:hypothetical protein
MDDQKNAGSKSTGKVRRRRKRFRSRAGAVLDPTLVAALGQIPESRADLVARGRRLARDPGYPSDETLKLISEILAAHLEFDGFSF